MPAGVALQFEQSELSKMIGISNELRYLFTIWCSDDLSRRAPPLKLDFWRAQPLPPPSRCQCVGTAMANSSQLRNVSQT
jgi:hypothetical protein